MIRIAAALLALTVTNRDASASDTASSAPFAMLSSLVAESGANVRRGITYGPSPRHRLDVYEPVSAQNAPIVLFFYGGSWTSGDRAYYGFLATALAKRGYTTVVADYRLHPEVSFPAFVDDAARAYGWAWRTLAKGQDRARPIYVMGHSAGAHIAALLALDPGYRNRFSPGSPRPAGLIGLSGPYAFDPTTWDTTAEIFATTAGNPDAARPVAVARASQESAGGLRVLLLHGSSDTVVTPQASVELKRVLEARGANVTKIDYPLIGHIGLITAYARPLRWRASTLDDTLRFLARHPLR